MNLIADMKMIHAKKFKEGSIKQATFLKSFKKEIFELVDLGYKPSEIRGYLEEKLEVNINMNAFYAWLNYTKSEYPDRCNDNVKEIASTVKEPISSNTDAIRPENTLDILSSTDFD